MTRWEQLPQGPTRRTQTADTLVPTGAICVECASRQFIADGLRDYLEPCRVCGSSGLVAIGYGNWPGLEAIDVQASNRRRRIIRAALRMSLDATCYVDRALWYALHPDAGESAASRAIRCGAEDPGGVADEAQRLLNIADILRTHEPMITRLYGLQASGHDVHAYVHAQLKARGL